MRLTKIKNIKKTVAIALAGTMIFGTMACGKKEKNKKENLPMYEAGIEAEFEGCIYKATVIDDVMYACYFGGTFEEEFEGELEETTEESGLITYDFKTKEKKQVALDEKNTSINAFYVDEENNINITGTKTVDNINEGTEEEKGYLYEEIKFVYNTNLECTSKESTTISYADMDTDLINGEMLMDVEVDNAGRIYLMYVKATGAGEEYYIKVTDKDDKEVANISFSEIPGSMIRMSDGSIVCSILGENGTKIYKLDVEANKLGEKIIELTDSYAMAMYPGLNNSILLNVGGYLKRVNCDTNKLEKILKFSDSEIISDFVVNVIEKENEGFCVVLQDYEAGKSEIDRLIKQDENTVKKEEIHLGAFSIASGLREQVIRFNKSNDKYKIIIDEYMSDDEDEYEEALKRFEKVLNSSDCPDIIDLSSISINEYVEKGVLESLEAFLENDDEIKEEIFVQSVLNKFKVDDKIYTIPIDFTIRALSGAKNKLGEGCSWSVKEFVDYAESLPEGTQITPDFTADELLWTILFYSMDEYVNLDTKECNFNSEEFIELLRYCGNFEKMEDYEYDEETYDELYLIRNNKIVLRDFRLENIYAYLEEKAVFGEEITIKGYPTRENNGIVIENYSPLLGISAKSEHKDVAWEFLRQLYTEEYQADYRLHGFSIRQDKLNEGFDKIKNMDVHIAEDGTKYISTYGYNNKELYIAPITEEDIEEIRGLIDSADMLGNVDGEILRIIMEETDKFFKGKKSSKEVVEVIQKRVSDYLK